MTFQITNTPAANDESPDFNLEDIDFSGLPKFIHNFSSQDVLGNNFKAVRTDMVLLSLQNFIQTTWLAKYVALIDDADPQSALQDICLLANFNWSSSKVIHEILLVSEYIMSKREIPQVQRDINNAVEGILEAA